MICKYIYHNELLDNYNKRYFLHEICFFSSVKKRIYIDEDTEYLVSNACAFAYIFPLQLVATIQNLQVKRKQEINI